MSNLFQLMRAANEENLDFEAYLDKNYADELVTISRRGNPAKMTGEGLLDLLEEKNIPLSYFSQTEFEESELTDAAAELEISLKGDYLCFTQTDAKGAPESVFCPV